MVDMYSRSKSCTAVGLRESTFNRQLSHHLSHQTTALNSMVSKAAIGSGSGSGHVSSSGVQGSNQGKARGRKVWGFSEEGGKSNGGVPFSSVAHQPTVPQGSGLESTRAITPQTEEMDVIVPKRQSVWPVRGLQQHPAQAQAEAELKQLPEGPNVQAKGGGWFAKR